MKNHWIKILCITIALIFLVPTATACFSGDKNGGTTEPTTAGPTTPFSTEVPIVEINRIAPNNLDFAGMTEVALATSEEGALVVNEAARIWVPPGAVDNDTAVTIKTVLRDWRV